jgi:uncharacterized membrane protein (DUF106 family)
MYNNNHDPLFDQDGIFKRTFAICTIGLIVIILLIPSAVSLRYIFEYMYPIYLSDYFNLIIGIISLIVSLYFGIIYQFFNFGKIVKKVYKFYKIN